MNTVQNKQSELNIDPMFKDLIRPLSFSELNQLEESIKKDGCMSSIVIWGSRNIILDGHNRFEICIKNNIEFKTISLEFLNDNDAKIWVINNQFSRRNLSAYERSLLALKLDGVIKEQARENQLSGLKQNSVQQNSDKRNNEEINTNKKLSKLAGVSHDTIARVRKIEECADDETKKQLLKSKISINQVYEKIKKSLAKETKTDNNNETDESPISTEKFDIICTEYKDELNFKTIESMLNDDACVFLWTKPQFLKQSLNIFEKIKLNYLYAVVWNHGDEKNMYELLLIAYRGNLNFEKIDFKRVYTEVPSENTDKPNYYEELIEKWLPNKSIKFLK